MKKLFPLAALLLLPACMMSKEEVANIKENEVLTIVNLRVKMDNNEETSYKNQCGVAIKDEKGTEYINMRKDKDTGYYMIKTPPGKMKLDRLGCMSNRVFFNKHRIAPLKDVTFVAEPGSVNYLGDLNVEWDSDRLNVGDFVLGMGGMIPDEGTLVIGLQQRPEAAQQYLAKEYPTITLPLKSVPLSDSPQIVR